MATKDIPTDGHRAIPRNDQPVVPAKIRDRDERVRNAYAALSGLRMGVSVDSAEILGR